MSSRPRKFLLAALALLAASLLGACGNAHKQVTTGSYAGENGVNAPYLNVGPLLYEVQISRQLNPTDIEDASYLQGLSPAEAKLEPGQEWFGVFIQVYNTSSHAHPAANTVTISDTQNNVYVPVEPDQTNLFAYRGGLVPSKGRLPQFGSVAADGPTQGQLLLFKIQIVSLDNRPLRVKIVNPLNAAQTASAVLDA